MIGDAHPARVVTLGECMASFVARERGPMPETTDFLRTIAGAEANVAVGLARLGVPVSFIGRVGADGLGTTILRRLRGEGVDVSHLHVDGSATTGVMIRELRDLGPSEVTYWRAGSAGSRISGTDVEAASEVIVAAAWLHITGITPSLSASAGGAVDEAVATARAAGTQVSMDVNYRRRLWTEEEARWVLRPLVAHCDTVIGDLDELSVLANTGSSQGEPDVSAVAGHILSLGPSAVVLKLGPEGALEFTADGSTRAAARKVDRAVDPVGAGDAFCAGYIAARLGGLAPAEVLEAANACGAAVVSTLGDTTGMPTATELAALIGAGSARDVDR